MKRQRYFPCLVAERPEWFNNLATQLTPANVTLELDAAHGMTQARDAAPHRSHAIIGVRPEVG